MSRPLPDLARIQRLRELFLAGSQAGGTIKDYWRDAVDIDAYDAVLAQRIGWKWDAALQECADRGFGRADGQVILDYGCGSGVAARRFVAHFGAGEVLLHDRSAHAMAYAQQSLAAAAPSLSARPLPNSRDAEPDILLVSHVLGEIDQDGEDELRSLIAKSKRVILVEPGNREIARRLSRLRDALRETFTMVAPCPHQGACPALAAEQDWCHFFATPPPEVFTDGFWARVARELSIDLRSLPYAFLAMTRQDHGVTAPEPASGTRLLGRAEMHKHFARLRSCTEGGLEMLEITKRTEPKIYKALKKRPEQVREAQATRDLG